MSTTSAFTTLVLLLSVFLTVPTYVSGHEDSWAVLKSEILDDWNNVLEKYQSELATKNTFVTSGTMFNEKVKITYRIKGDLSIRHFESNKESTIIGYNRDYSFMIIKAGDGPWQLEHIKLTDLKDSERTVRFPEVEQDFMSGDVTNLRKSIENAKSPSVQKDPGRHRIRLVFASTDDASLEHAEIELDNSDGHYLPVRFSRRAANGKPSVHEFEWEVSPSGLPTCVAATMNSGEVSATIEIPRFDKDLSDSEFHVSHYGLPEPTLPNKNNSNWRLIWVVLGGVVVACFGFYLKRRKTV